jgi:photosystem II stability/assembly factor-like uncharacterized protein
MPPRPIIRAAYSRRCAILITLVTAFLCVGCLRQTGPPVERPPIIWVEQESGTEESLLDVCFPSDSVGTAVGFNSTILHTTDGGRTWTMQQPPVLTHYYGVDFVDDDIGVVVGDDSTIIMTWDGGDHWQAMVTGGASWFRSVSMVDDQTITTAGVARDPAGPGYVISILRSTDAGQNWMSQESDDGRNPKAISFANADVGVAVGWSGLFIHTSDGGATWQPYPDWDSTDLNDVQMVTPEVGFVVGWLSILRTQDGGETWNGLPGVWEADNFSDLYGVSFVNTMAGLLVGGNDIFYTVDGGDTWVQQGGFGSGWSGLRAVSMLDEHAAVVVGYDGIILRSTNLEESLGVE